MSVKIQKAGTSRAKPQPGVVAKPQTPPASTWWVWAVAFGAALTAALIAFGPALQGQFVFDDAHMYFASPHPDAVPLIRWLTGSRPLIGLSYWLNYQTGGANPLTYHLTNVLLHTVVAALVFLIVRRIFELGAPSVSRQRRTLVAAFCGALFLLHPLQTEAVDYISGRSECLSVALAFAAWTCFLYRPVQAGGENGEGPAGQVAIGWGTVLAILILFASAVTAKEHVVVLPVVILLTDYYWNPGFSTTGIRRNWRIYAMFALVGVALAAFLYSYLANAPSVGFSLKEFTWYQYLFTQSRVVFLYLRLFLLPFGQSADYAIEPSRTLFDHGAIFFMAAWIAAAACAFVWRKRFPIASFGFFVALIFFLPTSSFVPIKDLAAERRLYLPMIGLLLMAAEFLLRWRADTKILSATMAIILLFAGFVTWNRSEVWSSQLALWTDTVDKSPRDARAHLGLASAYYGAHRYAEAAKEYEMAKDLGITADGLFYSSLAASLDGAGRLKEAIQMGSKAVELSPKAPTYAVQAKLLAMDGEVQQALELLEKAEKNDSSYEPTYIERGVILMAIGRNDAACASFERARSLDPGDPSAAKGLVTLGCGKPR